MLLLTSFPNTRPEAALVKARGRVAALVGWNLGGTGDMSIGTPYSLSGSLGGEFNDTVDAKESSKSEERSSSSCLSGVALCCLCVKVVGTLRNSDVMSGEGSQSASILCFLLVCCRSRKEKSWLV